MGKTLCHFKQHSPKAKQKADIQLVVDLSRDGGTVWGPGASPRQPWQRCGDGGELTAVFERRELEGLRLWGQLSGPALPRGQGRCYPRVIFTVTGGLSVDPSSFSLPLLINRRLVIFMISEVV